MLKILANQRRITAVLSRACLPEVGLSSLRNTYPLKDYRRSFFSRFLKSVYGFIFPRPLSEGHYHVWSLISNEGDSFMQLVGADTERPRIECSGKFDTGSYTLIKIEDSSTLDNLRVSFSWERDGVKRYSLSVHKDTRTLDFKYIVVAKVVEVAGNSERWKHLRHGSYSMFQSHMLSTGFLGCSEDGSLHLVHVTDVDHPDPRVLFLVHAK